MSQLLALAEEHATSHAQSVKFRDQGDLYEATYWQRRQRASFQSRAQALQIAAAEISVYDPEEVYEGQFLEPIGENDPLAALEMSKPQPSDV